MAHEAEKVMNEESKKENENNGTVTFEHEQSGTSEPNYPMNECEPTKV